MNKKIALFILAVGLILTGCQLNGVKEKTSSPETVNPSAVNVNHDLLEKPEEVEAFDEAIQTAEKQNEKMDIREPDYDAVIDWKGIRQSIHLWLEVNVDYGMFTYISDTGTGFKLTKESTIRLRDLIQGIRYEPELAKNNYFIYI